MTKNMEIEFNNIVRDILKNEQFLMLKKEYHHGMNRLDHSLNVARMTYLFCKKTHNKNTVATTRAAMLHDFFRIDELDGHMLWRHPVIAYQNACKYYEMDELQKNIILSHMFPLCKTKPKYKECILVSTIDKFVALFECAKYKTPVFAGSLLLFIMNFALIPRQL